MDLINEGIKLKTVERTTLMRKLTIDGITRIYPVFKVRLDCLFYNDQNDRIATWMSQYRAQHDGNAPDLTDIETYNSVIEDFIVKSNPQAIKKTQTNIELVDQREPGVVLSDGRIIDGNRRFTCLRRLAKNNDRFGYFETVILDHTIENNAKQIKMLELSIQHGEESKVDYNPVDRLVGIYHDIIETKLLNEEEYAKSINCNITDVKSQIELANLMAEFLEFINAPKQFYIARELQITYPLEELLKLMKKCHDEDEKEDMKLVVFNNILNQPTGDMTRFVRNFKSIIGSDYQEEFIEEQKQLVEKTLDNLPEVGKVTTEFIRDEIRSNEELNDKLNRSVEKTITKVKKNETRNRPIQLTEKATNFIEEIDTNIILKMSDSELQRLKRQIAILEDSINQLKELIK